eukprot:3643090-Karenia_brevis.AAC.1
MASGMQISPPIILKSFACNLTSSPHRHHAGAKVHTGDEYYLFATQGSSVDQSEYEGMLDFLL